MKNMLLYRLATIYTSDEVITKGPGKIFEISNSQNIKYFYEVLFDWRNNFNKIVFFLFQDLIEKEEILFVKVLSRLLMLRREFSKEVVGSFFKIIA